MSAQRILQATSRLHGYGWVPDLPDQRDYKFGVIYKIPAKLPDSVDLRSQCSPVEDQGNLGSCTANALVGTLEFLERKDQVAFADLSRLFIYYNERVIEHTVRSDSGAMLRDGIKTLAKLGVCAEAKWPYVISRFAKKPSAACYKEATDHQTAIRGGPIGESEATSPCLILFRRSRSRGRLLDDSPRRVDLNTR